MHTYTSENSIFDGHITNLPSILCILIEVLPCAHANRKKNLNDFKFGTFIGCFLSEGMVSMAAKGLRVKGLRVQNKNSRLTQPGSPSCSLL